MRIVATIVETLCHPLTAVLEVGIHVILAWGVVMTGLAMFIGTVLHWSNRLIMGMVWLFRLSLRLFRLILGAGYGLVRRSLRSR